jgi:universal stress protein E
MSSIERILTVVDRQRDATLSIERATDIALATGASVDLYGCEYDAALFLHYALSSKDDKLSKNAYVAECEAWLEKRAEQMRERGIEVSVYADWCKDPTAGVLARLEEQVADLVIKDTHHDSRLRRTFFHYSDWALIRDCPVPLLLAKRGTRDMSGPVVAAVDPLHDADPKLTLEKRIWTYAAAFAEREGRACELFHAINVLPETLPLAMDVVVYADYDKVLREQTRRIIDDFAEKNAINSSAVVMREGPPVVALPEYANDVQASLVVMGSVSRSHASTPFIATTAEAVLGRLDCDVLVINVD